MLLDNNTKIFDESQPAMLSFPLPGTSIRLIAAHANIK